MSFAAKSKFYDKYAIIQREIAEFTANFADVKPDGLWLDLGSGTGFAKNSILNKFSNINVISLDIALTDKIDICADFDFLPFVENSFDKIISCSALQWSKNIENLMVNIYNILNKNGKLILSFFENGTLENLQEMQKKFGIIPQVLFYDKNYFENLAKKTGFEILAVENRTFSQKFSDGYSALKSISKIGASNHNGKFLSSKELKTFISQYGDDEIIHDYKTLFYILGKK